MDERDERLGKMLRMVAPGTALREGLENILRARTGGLIVVGDGLQVINLVDGGFRIDADLTPANLYELAKMDGALIVSHDLKRILMANVLLAPDTSVATAETGIRHRIAQRVSKQTGETVIAISQRRNLISLYKGNIRYVLQDTNVILSKANHALHTLEKYRAELHKTLLHLTRLEMEDQVTLADVCIALQRADVVLRIAREIERLVLELGSEGRLVQMQLKELAEDVDGEADLLVRDYVQGGETAPAADLSGRGGEDLPDPPVFGRLLGYGSSVASLELPATARGYRVLRKLPRIPAAIVDNLVAAFNTLPQILQATPEQLDDVDGIGEIRARVIREGLGRLRTQVERQS